MRPYGVTFHIRGRMDNEVKDDDASDVAEQAIFYAQSLFWVLTMFDSSRLSTEVTERGDVPGELENIGELGTMLLSAALTHVDQLEHARKETLAAQLQGPRRVENE